MFGAEVVVAESARLRRRVVEQHPFHPPGQPQQLPLRSRVARAGPWWGRSTGEDVGDSGVLGVHTAVRHAKRAQCLGGQPVVFPKQPEQQVPGADVVTAQSQSLQLRQQHHLASLVGERPVPVGPWDAAP